MTSYKASSFSKGTSTAIKNLLHNSSETISVCLQAKEKWNYQQYTKCVVNMTWIKWINNKRYD